VLFFNVKNDERLEELLNAPEGEHYQFKEAKTRYSFEDAAKCCCALSNCGGGKLVLGISDKRPRKVVGSKAFEQPERTREGLIEKLRVRVDFKLYEDDGERVLVFEVASRPVGIPVQVDGTAWWYSGDSLIPMPEDVRRDIYFEIEHDFSSDICSKATIKDLDNTAIEAFRSVWAEKSGNKRIRSYSAEQLMRDSGAITNSGITYAALILFGTSSALTKFLPQSEIVFEYRSSDASGPAQQRENFRIGFFACYNRIWELINLRNDMQHYQKGLFVFDVPSINERVAREALLNAVCHRNYQLGGSIFVRQYREKRLVIESPGGFPIGITLDNILDRQSPRNRRIAEIMALCGLVERSGQGMNLIYELSIKEAKSLPDFSGTDANFVCITLKGVLLDEKMLLLINEIGIRRLEYFSTDDYLLVNALFHEQKLSENLRSRTKNLIDMGIIERVSRNNFVLSRSLYGAIGKSGKHTRLKGLDRDTNKELVFKHIKKSGENGAPMKELQQVLPSHSRSEIQVLLRELRENNRVYVAGKTKNARWFSN
jgi:ATP-dependent DNA helicase RecG